VKLYCDLCGDRFDTDNMVSVHCGSYICNDCILLEARKIKAQKVQVENPIHVDKPWGSEIIYSFDSYIVKKLIINKRHKLSLQYHEVKHETLILLKGIARLWRGAFKQEMNVTVMLPGEIHVIEPYAIHRIEAMEDSIILECSTTELDDVVRLQDDYGRGCSQ